MTQNERKEQNWFIISTIKIEEARKWYDADHNLYVALYNLDVALILSSDVLYCTVQSRLGYSFVLVPGPSRIKGIKLGNSGGPVRSAATGVSGHTTRENIPISFLPIWPVRGVGSKAVQHIVIIVHGIVHAIGWSWPRLLGGRGGRRIDTEGLPTVNPLRYWDNSWIWEPIGGRAAHISVIMQTAWCLVISTYDTLIILPIHIVREVVRRPWVHGCVRFLRLDASRRGEN